MDYLELLDLIDEPRSDDPQISEYPGMTHHQNLQNPDEGGFDGFEGRAPGASGISQGADGLQSAQSCRSCRHLAKPGLSDPGYCDQRTDQPHAYGSGHPLHRLPPDNGANCKHFHAWHPENTDGDQT